MAGDRQDQVVVFDIHRFDEGTHAAPVAREARQGRRIRFVVGQEDRIAIVEQFGETRARAGVFGTGQGVTGDEVHRFR